MSAAVTVSPDARQVRDALAVLKHLVDAYDEGVEIAWKPKDCWDALDTLARLVAERDGMRAALSELASVPSAGPFPNKGACRAFAEYVQGVARAVLAAAPAAANDAMTQSLNHSPVVPQPGSEDKT